jgi:hypothetical protein
VRDHIVDLGAASLTGAVNHMLTPVNEHMGQQGFAAAAAAVSLTEGIANTDAGSAAGAERSSCPAQYLMCSSAVALLPGGVTG